MASEFGRGVLAEGPGSEPLLPPLPETAARPSRPHTVPQRRKAPNPYSSFGFTVVKMGIVLAMGVAVVVGLAAMNRLPPALQDAVADSAETFGLDLPHHDETLWGNLPGQRDPGFGVPAGGPSVTTLDPDAFTVDPDTYTFDPEDLAPEIEIPTPPPTPPTVPAVP